MHFNDGVQLQSFERSTVGNLPTLDLLSEYNTVRWSEILGWLNSRSPMFSKHCTAFQNETKKEPRKPYADRHI